MKKFRRPRRKRTKEERFPAIEEARVEVGHGHGGGGGERLAIHLGLVFFDDVGVITNQPLPADGKLADALAFRNATFLPQMPASASRADEYELRPVAANLSGGEIL